MVALPVQACAREERAVTMAVLQHYYTSYVNRDSGSAGFQVKAMSSGIPPDTQATILRLISYRIPPTLDERALSTHPIALRYQYKNPHECIFLCSQSNGTDENGRPGNFFAHTLVMEPDFFTSMPPILYWRSQFWCTRDAGTNPTIASLVSLEDIEPTLDVENVWRFLAQGQNIEVFHKLMSAVVHCQRTHRRIVIIDSADNVAMWIAAVSCMLPPDYRPMLSFATYHHDPYQSQFMITGTTSDSSFRASPDEYMSYFIYDAAAGKISDVEASVYADEVKEAASSFTKYETRLLTLFTDYMPLFPAPTQIDEQLDTMALYVGMLEPTHPAVFTQAEIEALTIALDALKRMDSLPTDEISKLHRLRKLLWDAYREVKDPAIHAVRGQIVTLLMRHKASTGVFVLEELQYFTNVLVGDGSPESVLPRLKTMRSSYGEDMFLATLNSNDYLEWLSKQVRRFNPQQLQRIWMYLGQYIEPGIESSGLFFTSLQTLNTLRTGNQPGVLQALMDQMGRAMAQNKRGWLQLAVDGSTHIPGEELEHFYYYFAAQLPLDQRVPYRTILKAVRRDILLFEIENDVRSAGLQNGLAKIEEWDDHVKRRQYKPEFITYALNQLRNSCNQQQRVVLADQVLSSHRLAPLSPEAEGIFVQDMMSMVSLSKFSEQNVDLYNKYQDYEALPNEKKVVLRGILAMQSGYLDEEAVLQLRQHFGNVTENVYHAETKRFIADFCNARKDIARKHHLYMLNALFTWKYPDTFWQLYTEMLLSKLIDPRMTIQFIELLSFWFRVLPEELKPKYVVQDFFFRLPSVLEQAKNEQRSAKGLREFHIQAAKKEWYPSVQELSMERKGVLNTIGQSIIHVPKHFAGQGNDKEIQEREAHEREARERKYSARISALFDRKKARVYHEDLIPQLYQNRELFWSYYWGKFVKEVVVQDADLTLELLSFWFDEAYTTELGQVPFVVQDFFLGLARALEWARKERGFRENASRIHSSAMQVKEKSYPWYGLVQHLFSGAVVSKSGLFRRG